MAGQVTIARKTVPSTSAGRWLLGQGITIANRNGVRLNKGTVWRLDEESQIRLLEPGDFLQEEHTVFFWTFKGPKSYRILGTLDLKPDFSSENEGASRDSDSDDVPDNKKKTWTLDVYGEDIMVRMRMYATRIADVFDVNVDIWCMSTNKRYE